MVKQDGEQSRELFEGPSALMREEAGGWQSATAVLRTCWKYPMTSVFIQLLYRSVIVAGSLFSMPLTGGWENLD